MSDQFDTYLQILALAQQHKTKAALREAFAKSGIQLHETDPHSGYYRCAAVKDGPLLPVAIFRDGGTLHVLRGGEPVALERVWNYCAFSPIPYDWYEGVAERGEKWPDAADIVISADKPTIVPAGTIVGNIIAQIGDNNPPVEDEVATIRSQIENAKGVAEKSYATITTDDEAAAAQAMRSRLLSLSGDADKKREAEKKPHSEEAKKVDARWQPVVKLGKEAADWLRARLSDYATKKAQVEAEERRAAEAARLAELAAHPEKRDEIPSAEMQEPAPAQAVTIKGATGRAATVRAVKIARVVDYDKAYAHLKSIPEIKKAIETVAQRMVTAGNDVPGVEIEERRNVA